MPRSNTLRKDKSARTSISHENLGFPPESYWDISAFKSSGAYTWFREISEELEHSWVVVDGKKMLMMGGYSYLGLNKNEEITEAAKQSIDNYGTGMSGSRFLAGSTSIHEKLERSVADLHFKESAMLLTSGYLANVSTITALLRKGDFIIGDKHNHASINDGARYSEATYVRYRHNTPDHLNTVLSKLPKRARKLVITDSVYSMSGETADLPRIIEICKKWGATLMVDECHSMFVLGNSGGGIAEHFNLDPDDIDIVMATLSKAIPGSGGYIAANEKIIEFLKHESRGFVYSVALPALMASISYQGVEIFRRQRTQLVSKLQKNTRFFSDLLRGEGINVGNSKTSIVPIHIGDSQKATIAAKKLQDRGIFINAVFEPVVPAGKAILRASITAAHRTSDLFSAARTISGIIHNL